MDDASDGDYDNDARVMVLILLCESMVMMKMRY